MKKTIALLLAVIMCVSVTACGTGNTEAETVQEQTQPQPAEEVEAIQEDSSEVSETDNTSDIKVAKDGADMQPGGAKMLEYSKHFVYFPGPECDPLDQANACLFLASDMGKHVKGQVIQVCNGAFL